MLHKKMFKILALIPKKDGGTYWMRIGSGYGNKDDSINMFVDAIPITGKLQLREVTEEDLREREGRRSHAPSAGGAGAMSAAEPAPF